MAPNRVPCWPNPEAGSRPCYWPARLAVMAEETNGLHIALERIALEAKRRTGALDLGGLGLAKLPPELFALEHLHELNLGTGSPSFKRKDPDAPGYRHNRIAGQLAGLSRLSTLRCLSVDYTG